MLVQVLAAFQSIEIISFLASEAEKELKGLIDRVNESEGQVTMVHPDTPMRVPIFDKPSKDDKSSKFSNITCKLLLHDPRYFQYIK